MTNTTTKLTKTQLAKQIVEKNPKATRSELVRMFMDQLEMSKAGASTYAFNLAKNAPKRVSKKAEAAVHGAAKAVKQKKTKVAEPVTKEEIIFDKLLAKRQRDAARKREKRALAKAARELATA